MRRATCWPANTAGRIGDFYPRSPCGERPARFPKFPSVGDFYPRSPCGERLFRVAVFEHTIVFLSTLSLRRATDVNGVQGYRTLISIHALLAESDRKKQRRQTSKLHFYPRSPCGERLDQIWAEAVEIYISIHALLAESDRPQPPKARVLKNFYPRSPCGERHFMAGVHELFRQFLSTLSLRRATRHCRQMKSGTLFLSTLSLRRATEVSRIEFVFKQFLSTLSLRRATRVQTQSYCCN